MNKFYLIILKICPLLAFLYCVISVFVTIYISNEISVIYIFFLLQLHWNWYSAYKIAKQVSTLTVENFRTRNADLNIYQRTHLFVPEIDSKFWCCEKCQAYTRRATVHCPLCKKCYHLRDHHCYFMGTCVLHQNMGNFILLCFYAACICLYTLSVLGPYLFEHLNHIIGPDSSILNVILGFCFPIALARLLFSDQESCILLVTLFDALVATFCISICYGYWKLNASLTGKQIYNFNMKRKESIRDIFGYYGILNVLFPFDCLLNARYAENSDLKDV